MDRNATSESNKSSEHFPPVVAVLGHVDHGKTSLLDAVRKTSIAEREFGGITQKIGASSVETIHDDKHRKITFIDTPGHEAFANMRSRGTIASDIGLLIVSSADGVMPQTKESIELLKQAEIPFIVVLTKADLPTRNPEKAKQQLMSEGVMLEGLGGDVPVIEISAKTNQNIKELLDLILLVFDLHPHDSVSDKGELNAIVIESKLDAKSGPRATVVIKNGQIKLRDELSYEKGNFRVRTIINDQGKQIQQAEVGDAVELLGFTHVPGVGSLVKAKQEAVITASETIQQLKRDLIYQQVQQRDERLAIVLRADTAGALEAIVHALPEKVDIISSKTGEVSEADVLLARSTGALVIGFNTKIRPEVQKLAATEKVLAKNYNIIYELIDELSDVLEGKRLALIEDIFGQAQIMAKFPFEKTFAAGVKVLEGRVARGDKVRVVRGEEVVGEATVQSLRVGKNPVSKVEKNHEAGLIIAPALDFVPGDVIICHG